MESPSDGEAGSEGPLLARHTSVSTQRPRILLLGPHRSGKSSIQRVVFQKMSPHETLFLESTEALSIKFIANNPYVQFEVWDFPCNLNLSEGVVFEDQTLSADLIFGNATALVYVLDAQDEVSQDALVNLRNIVNIARSINPNMHFEVFIHKVDGDLFLSEDHKLDCQRDIQEQVELELEDAADTDITLSFYLTSIYDHSIFEAFSKVVHKLIPQLPAMENLLNFLIANCEVEKAFLFDVVSKIYVATDHNPVDIQSYELCSDMIDVVVDVSCIYGLKKPVGPSGPGARPDHDLEDDLSGDEAAIGQETGGATGDDDGNRSMGGYDGEQEGGASSEDDYRNPDTDDTDLDGLDGAGLSDDPKLEEVAFDRESASLIRLNNNMILYLRQVASYLALVCIVRTPNYEKQGLIDYNVECFRKSLAKLFCKPEDGDDTTGASPE